MTTIDRFHTGDYETSSDGKIELAHYLTELRIHALIMLFGATLAGYLGFRVWDMVDVPRDLLTYCIAAIAIAIAAMCLVEAGRTWGQAQRSPTPEDEKTRRLGPRNSRDWRFRHRQS